MGSTIDCENLESLLMEKENVAATLKYHCEYEYLKLVERILDTGKTKDDRTGRLCSHD